MADGIYVQTDRLVWRAGTPDDVDALHAIGSDFDIVRQTETWPWPPDRAFTVTRCLPRTDIVGVSGVVTHEDQVIGFTGVVDGSVGYMFARNHWGKGFATEMGRAAVAHAFAQFDWSELSACVFSDNPPSGRVLEKLGFALISPCEGPSAARGGVFPILNYALPRPQA